jgi:hypothetical protein
MTNHINCNCIPPQIERNPLSGWYNNIRPDDSCRKCNKAECDQLLDDTGEVELYICPKCGHEWAPDNVVGVEFEVTLIRRTYTEIIKCLPDNANS